MKHLKEEMKVLKFELSQAKTEIVQVKKGNERLKQAINLNIFANDDLDQYSSHQYQCSSHQYYLGIENDILLMFKQMFVSSPH